MNKIGQSHSFYSEVKCSGLKKKLNNRISRKCKLYTNETQIFLLFISNNTLEKCENIDVEVGQSNKHTNLLKFQYHFSPYTLLNDEIERVFIHQNPFFCVFILFFFVMWLIILYMDATSFNIQCIEYWSILDSISSCCSISIQTKFLLF